MIFKYTAKNKTGKLLKDVMEAKSELNLITHLKINGLIPIKITESISFKDKLKAIFFYCLVMLAV